MKNFNYKIPSSTIIGIMTLVLISLCVILGNQGNQIIDLKSQKLNLNNQIDSLVVIKDSLQGEIFVKEIEEGRHEVTRDAIFDMYPKVGLEYYYYYEHKTE
jgi:hypothetical protein